MNTDVQTSNVILTLRINILGGCRQVTVTASLSPSLLGMNVVGQEGGPDEHELSMSFD